MPRYHKVVGIDLGTTYSAVSVWDFDAKEGKGDVVVIPSALGATTVPSVVGLDPDGKVIVGSPAQNNLVSDPGNTIIEIKRDMGTYVEGKKPNPQTGFPGVPKTRRFLGRDFKPQEISAFILMELKRQAENFIGSPIHDAVITVPAYFHEPQKGATEDAAHLARLNVKRLINEPTAAAVAFGADKVSDDNRNVYAVYDLGGGTFDVSIIEVSKTSVIVVGTGGDPLLGGGDFDNRITDYVLQQIQQKYQVDLSQDPLICARIKREAEMRKRELAVANAAVLNLPYLTATISTNVTITRAIFEELISDLLQRSLGCFDQAIASAQEAQGVQRKDITQVLLVGGSTRVQKIRPMLAEHMGMDINDIRIDINPDEAVSRGAAIVAAEFNPSNGYEGDEIEIDLGSSPEISESGGILVVSKPPTTIVQDVTSHTLGILVNQSDFFPIIAKDSQIPAQQTKGDLINGGTTNVLEVMIFQGENPVAFENTLIGKLPINLPEPKQRGGYQFEVTFHLNTDGLLSVKVTEIQLKQDWKAEVQCNVRTSKKEIDEQAKVLAHVMAASSTAAIEGMPVPPAGGLPKPPLPKPPQATAAPQPAAQAQPQPQAAPAAAAPTEIPMPPENVPDEFKAIVRRSYKQINKMPEDKPRQKLEDIYLEFIEAVQAGAALDEIQNLGDELDDVFRESR
jgi:molecular chaperone DnaK